MKIISHSLAHAAAMRGPARPKPRRAAPLLNRKSRAMLSRGMRLNRIPLYFSLWSQCFCEEPVPTFPAML
jgi:hypothetical protein